MTIEGKPGFSLSTLSIGKKENNPRKLPSISVSFGPKQLIILQTLTPPQGYVETLNNQQPEYVPPNYALGQRILELKWNIPIREFNLSNKDFTDPITLDEFKKAVSEGVCEKYMERFFKDKNDSEVLFLLPQFAYDVERKPLLDHIALFEVKKQKDPRRPVFNLA